MADLSLSDSRQVDLTGADLRGARLERASLDGAMMANVRAGPMPIRGHPDWPSNLTLARLPSASLVNAELMGALLIRADLSNANLRDADLTDASLCEARLTDAYFERPMIQFSALSLTIGRFVLDLLLPPQCICCDTAVNTQGQLCADCFRRTDFLTGQCCARCGVPFGAAAQGNAAALCPSCLGAPPRFGRARGALRYDAQARQLILPLKHADRPELAAMLAPHMARAGAALLRDPAEAGRAAGRPVRRADR